MIKILLVLSILFQTSIYTIHFSNINGTETSFETFSGKKILIVNIATGSSHVDQLAGLEHLYEQYHDSLIIIAFPSNSFGAEEKSNVQIQQFCEENYNSTFIIAEKGEVTGSSKEAIYNWLENGIENDAVNVAIVGDFQKILIDKSGEIMGIYAPEVDPQSDVIKNAIESN